MQEYLYRIQPVRPAMLSEGATADEEAAVAEHFAYLKRLTDEGVVILAGRTLNTDASSFGIVIFQATFTAARSKGYEKLFTFARADNPAAQATYLRHGFTVVGTVRGQAKINDHYIDELMIEKFL